MQGPQHPDFATSHNNLAVLYVTQGRYVEAEQLHTRSLAIREKALGLDHPEVGSSLNNLGDLYRLQGRYAESEAFLKRSLRIIENASRGKDHQSISTALNNLALLYEKQGRFAEAEPLYKRSLAIAEKALGVENTHVGTALNNLGELYRLQGQFAEAEQLLNRSLAIREKKLGAEHADVGNSLNNLAMLYLTQGSYAKAEQLWKRNLVIAEKALGLSHPTVAHAVNNLARLYERQGRYDEAEPLYKRGLIIHEKSFGPDHPDVATSLANLGGLHKILGRSAEAEGFYKRSLAIRQKAFGTAHPDVGTSLNDLAALYEQQGRFAEAEVGYKRSLGIREQVWGHEHAEVAQSLNNIAGLFWAQSRYAEAEQLLKRALVLFQNRLGQEHPEIGTALNNLGLLYQTQGRYREAEPLFKRSVGILQKALGYEHPNVGNTLNNLANLYQVQHDYAEAEPLYRRSVAILEKALGPDHSKFGASLQNLGALYRAQGRFNEAEPLLRRSSAIMEKALGPQHPDVGMAFSALALLAYAQSDWPSAAKHSRRSVDTIRRRSERGLSYFRGAELSGQKSPALAREFVGLIKIIYRTSADGRDPRLAGEMFEMAQWALDSAAATSLAQMAARSAKASVQLSLLVRERQDLVNEWAAKDKLLITAKSEEPAKRETETEKALAHRLTAIDILLSQIDQRFKRDFPDYAALTSPVPVAAAEIQAQLDDDEALVLFLDTPEFRPLTEETFIWVVTKNQLRWVRSDLGSAALAREVDALRCGLDLAAWDGGGYQRCSEVLGAPRTQPLSFDPARAYGLYNALFGEVQDLIKGKHLLIVPSGPLTQLPFQVLVTKARMASKQNYRATAWLAREHAITILPAVSSLKALRRVGKSSTAPRPMIGIGNPLLDGPDDSYASQAKEALAKQRCVVKPGQLVATRKGHRESAERIARRGSLANVAEIRTQVPLPETRDELCAVAHEVKADTGRDILLGAKATEREVKRLSGTGELAKYRMVHFATHGFLAGTFEGVNEPGLILAPPSAATEEDDGYLSASEIAALKLDADWVILSACNTAAGAATSAEALSGLARAFIYAQARALLVSLWEVYSHATVKLITGTVREMARDPKVGRAEALRRSMLEMIEKGAPHEAHPAYWAPFVLVGEGASGR